ncbi:MAG: sensor histidine kinase, partial [Flammeovirgaceae bacterium]|nr:sensor histidine kinase [Flammeovirgaceae bacterium]
MVNSPQRIVYVVLLIFAFFSGKAQISKGQLVASQHDFKKGELRLAGEWEFYWNQLLAPDFTESTTPVYLQVPGSWHRQGNYDLLGFATYRVQLVLPAHQQGLSLIFPIINSSAKIWINGVLVTETGKVSADKKNYEAKLANTIVSLPDYTKQIEVVVQIANYTYFSSGMGRTPIIDQSASVFTRMSIAKGIENFFAGSLMAMFVYQLILYFLYHRGKPYLWLGLICLGVALRAMIVHGGSFLLPDLFPNVSWEVWKKLEFGSVYLMIMLFPLYIYHLFTEQAPRWPLYFFVSVAGILGVTTLVTPQYIYGQLLDICHLSLLLTFIYAVYSIVRAWRAGNEDARIILFGVLASFPFILIEILKNSIYIPIEISFMYLVELGVLVFLLFQVYLLATHHAKSFKRLEVLNTSLEKVVAERTEELVTANSVKDKLLSVMSHDIKSPLNSLRGILQLYNKGALTQQEFGEFTRQVEGDLGKTSILVENILYWTASQLKGIQMRKEYFDLRALIEENVQLFKTIADRKEIQLQFAVPHMMLRWDRNVLNLVLRNLISNAIKFSFEKSSIDIVVTPSGDQLHITVRDYGKGIDEE